MSFKENKIWRKISTHNLNVSVISSKYIFPLSWHFLMKEKEAFPVNVLHKSSCQWIMSIIHQSVIQIPHKNELLYYDFLSKCDQIPRKLWIWSHLLMKSVMGKFIFVQWCITTELKVTLIWLIDFSKCNPLWLANEELFYFSFSWKASKTISNTSNLNIKKEN